MATDGERLSDIGQPGLFCTKFVSDLGVVSDTGSCRTSLQLRLEILDPAL